MINCPDAILDAYLSEDPYAKCAIECLATGNTLIIAREAASGAVINIEKAARKTIREIGYTDSSSGFRDQCEIQLVFVIGEEKPISVRVDTFGTGIEPDAEIESYISTRFDLSVYGIIEQLQLRKPVYKQVAAYGHFGRNDLNLSWEKIIKID